MRCAKWLDQKTQHVGGATGSNEEPHGKYATRKGDDGAIHCGGEEGCGKRGVSCSVRLKPASQQKYKPYFRVLRKRTHASASQPSHQNQCIPKTARKQQQSSTDTKDTTRVPHLSTLMAWTQLIVDCEPQVPTRTRKRRSWKPVTFSQLQVGPRLPMIWSET